VAAALAQMTNRRVRLILEIEDDACWPRPVAASESSLVDAQGLG
jgi:hypothetical protein